MGRHKKVLEEGTQEAVLTEDSIKDNPVEKVLEKEKVETGEYNLEIIRDYDGVVDPFYLSKKDPNYVYRFLRDEHKNLSLKTGNLLLQKGGWQITPRTHLMKLGFKEKDISPDGMLRRGDQILAFMPRKLWEEKESYKRKQAEIPMKGINRLLKKGDSSVGKELHHTMKGIQTKEDLGM